jgi:hypothetical protein
MHDTARDAACDTGSSTVGADRNAYSRVTRCTCRCTDAEDARRGGH